MRVAIIPARGGSKRIPRKNVRLFCGKPMVGWSIDAARDSGCFDRIVVSTDDPEIAAVAQQCGADVPFMRPANLSDDHTGTTTVIQHAVQWLISHGDDVSDACCLYATAPFVMADDLRQGLERLRMSGAQYAFSVTSFPAPIQRALKMTKTGGVELLHPEHAQTRSQDLEETYHDAGQFYWGTREAWLAAKAILAEHSVPIVLPRFRVQDIDTPEDWERATWMFEAMRNQSRDRKT